MCVICCSVIGTGEWTCTSDGAGNAGSAKELSRGECVCMFVYGCVSMYVCVYGCVGMYVCVYECVSMYGCVGMYGCVCACSSKETISVHTCHSLLGF